MNYCVNNQQCDIKIHVILSAPLSFSALEVDVDVEDALSASLTDHVQTGQGAPQGVALLPEEEDRHQEQVDGHHHQHQADDEEEDVEDDVLPVLHVGDEGEDQEEEAEGSAQQVESSPVADTLQAGPQYLLGLVHTLQLGVEVLHGLEPHVVS